MPKLEPRTQWVCDSCGKIIQKPEDGYLEFLQDDQHRRHSFRIAHSGSASPRNPNRPNYVRQPSESCLVHAYNRDPKAHDGGFHLDRVVGPGGINVLLAMLDRGEAHQPTFNHPNVVSVREWVELVRRLALPYYEEARHYIDRARNEEPFGGMNEFALYDTESLLAIIEQFGGDRKPEDEPPFHR